MASLRVALDRAYGVQQSRPWWLRRLIGVGFVVIGAVTLLASSVLVVLWPVIRRSIVAYAPDLKGLRIIYDAVRYSLASAVLVVGLVATHLWLPNARARLRDVLPGVVVTLTLWLLGATLYGQFLARFTHIKTTYAGLAGILTALVILQVSAAILIFGAELNAAIRKGRGAMELTASPSTNSGSGLISASVPKLRATPTLPSASSRAVVLDA